MSVDNVIQYAALGDRISPKLQLARAHRVVAGVILNDQRNRIVAGIAHNGTLFTLNPDISLAETFDSINPQTCLPDRLNNLIPLVIFPSKTIKQYVLNRLQSSRNTFVLSSQDWITLERLITKQTAESSIASQVIPNAIQYVDGQFIPISSKSEEHDSKNDTNVNNQNSQIVFDVRWQDLQQQIDQQKRIADSNNNNAIDLKYKCIPWLFYVLNCEIGPGLIKPCTIRYEYHFAFVVNMKEGILSISENLEDYINDFPARLMLLPFRFMDSNNNHDMLGILLVDRARKNVELFSEDMSSTDLPKAIHEAISLIGPIASYHLYNGSGIYQTENELVGKTLYLHLRILAPDCDPRTILEALERFNLLDEYAMLINSVIPENNIARRMFEKHHGVPWLYTNMDRLEPTNTPINNNVQEIIDAAIQRNSAVVYSNGTVPKSLSEKISIVSNIPQAPNVFLIVNPNFQTVEICDPFLELINENGDTKTALVNSLLEMCNNLFNNNNYSLHENKEFHSNYLLYLNTVLLNPAVPSAIIDQLLQINKI